MTYTIHGRHIIVLGDRTTHGGQVISGSMTFSYLGVPVARVGDQVTCPRCGGVHKIVEGTENTFDHDMPVAVHDCRTSCGARLIAESANKPWNPAWADGLSSPRFEAPPKAPPPLNDSEMRAFHTQAEKQSLGDRKTLAQYRKVTAGISLSAGHYSGWENRDIPINGEALVYVKNIGVFVTPAVVRAGPCSGEIQTQGLPLAPFWGHLFKFTGSPGSWHISVDAPTDSYNLKIEVWTKDIYAD